FANVLEQLEVSFYQQGLTKFQPVDFTTTGFMSPMIMTQMLTTIQSDKGIHNPFIQAALTANGVTPPICTFNFTSRLTDIAMMVATAHIIEYIWVAVYSGVVNLL
ncbi:hypothetical protein DFH08DRAFT_642788, partial [Mycena albidolilacea]